MGQYYDIFRATEPAKDEFGGYPGYYAVAKVPQPGNPSRCFYHCLLTKEQFDDLGYTPVTWEKVGAALQTATGGCPHTFGVGRMPNSPKREALEREAVISDTD